MHILHQELLDSDDMNAILLDFCSRSEVRQKLFGRFWQFSYGLVTLCVAIPAWCIINILLKWSFSS